jgi:class 3 adenylate cyclase
VLGALRVRMALHTGAARLPDVCYFGSAHKTVASLLGSVRGGQTVLSAVAAGLVRGSLPVGSPAVRDLGERGLGRSF